MMPYLKRASFPTKITALAILMGIASCRSSQKQKTHQPAPTVVKEKLFSLTKPLRNTVYKLNDSVHIQLASANNQIIDSASVYLNNELILVYRGNAQSFYIKEGLSHTGPKNLQLNVYSDTTLQSVQTKIRVLSNIIPIQYGYSVVNKLPHNVKNYTQGLFIHDNHIYESTGLNKQSRVIKSGINNQTVLLEHKLDDRYFGEGITRVNDKIYQLSYRSGVGFIYQLNNFEKLAEFNLQIQEGWGITYDGANLIMSDGSARLYFVNPEYFNQIRQVFVADNEGFIRNLNELEYVDGTIWANIYTRKQVVQIDPESGKVIGKLDLSGLFPKDIPDDYDHVLNGIAYHPERGTFFVTGKLWPVMYEIKLKE